MTWCPRVKGKWPITYFPVQYSGILDLDRSQYNHALDINAGRPTFLYTINVFIAPSDMNRHFYHNYGTSSLWFSFRPICHLAWGWFLNMSFVWVGYVVLIGYIILPVSHENDSWSFSLLHTQCHGTNLQMTKFPLRFCGLCAKVSNHVQIYSQQKSTFYAHICVVISNYNYNFKIL